MNLADALVATAQRSGDATAIVYGEVRVTYRDLESDSARTAAALTGLGADAGDRIALWLGNHPCFAVAMYGAWRMGGVVVPLHAGLTAPEARHILEDSGARVLVCGPEQYAAAGAGLREELGGLEHVVVITGDAAAGDMTWDYFLRAGGGAPPATAVAPDHLALIGYTSGTSGLPKGAMLTHHNLRANIDQMLQSPVATRPDDVVLCVLPLFHIFGLNVVLNLAVSLGATVCLMERFEPSEAVDAIRRHGVTVVAGAPPVYVAWLSIADATAEDFATVRVAVSGAAPLPRDVLTGFADRFGVTIWEGYGLTETAPTLTSNAMGGVPKPGSVGKPLPGVDIRLVAADGEDAEPGDPGEVLVRGPNVFGGYWQHPDDTQKAFTNGWFRTGDVGIFDDDGYLFLVDRSRDMIIVSGFNVYPKEVENVLRDHPAVADCAVVGQPDPYSGERVKAYVVASPDGGVMTGDLVAFCRTRLAPYKVPSEVEVVADIPRNAAGKVLRRTLRD
jgi:long-chain acyl-CoA synthetase